MIREAQNLDGLAYRVSVLEGQVANRVCVRVLPSGFTSLTRFDFQACSFNHSDISPADRLWHTTFSVDERWGRASRSIGIRRMNHQLEGAAVAESNGRD